MVAYQSLPRRLRVLLLSFILAVTAALPAACASTIPFAPASGDVPSPERGWWAHGGDFLRGDGSATWWMRAQRDAGVQTVFALVVLDDWRDRDLSPAFLIALERALQRTRRAGVKLILRFTYNNPPDSIVYAPDAPLRQVLRHIRQLAPVLRANRDTLAVIQAGFIGRWGEGHGSTHGLDSPANAARIRDALLAQFPPQVFLQWRRPVDLMAWTPEERGRFGFHNDCFLSSPTDVGTYPDTETDAEPVRRFAAALTDVTPFTAETCYQDPPVVQRDSCADILREGADYHLTTLHQMPWSTFYQNWQAGGCLAEVAQRLGYRLVLQRAEIGARRLAVTVTNEGWSRVFSRRPLLATLWRDGRTRGAVALGGAALLGDVGPGETLTFVGRFDRRLRPGDEICLSSPDPIRPGVAAYALRFANAGGPGVAGWDAARAAFCFAVP